MDFYPRPPRGGRPSLYLVDQRPEVISIPALREEGDVLSHCVPLRDKNFYPRPPRGGRPRPFVVCARLWGDFYPRPPRGGRLGVIPDGHAGIKISIPALREEGDVRAVLCCQCNMNFYPRPPRGGRPADTFPVQEVEAFLSPPSARRATIRLPSAYPPLHISIPALREEGDQLGV